jgi:acetyl-CoA acetyltransferase
MTTLQQAYIVAATRSPIGKAPHGALSHYRPDDLLACVIQGMLAQAGWRPPLQQTFPVAGRDAIATLKVQLVNMQVGGFISAHDFTVAEKVA